MSSSRSGAFGRLLANARSVLQRVVRESTAPPSTRKPAPPKTSSVLPPCTPIVDYPGDFAGRPKISYRPLADQQADPGEVVWTWVPFEEDHTRGKDRPVLIIGLDSPWLLALQLTSKDHDRDAAQEARQGRFWVEIGSGEWDRSGRVSEARVNRIIRVAPESVRRTGGRVNAAVFEMVTGEVLEHY